jgi:hypothetical protein
VGEVRGDGWLGAGVRPLVLVGCHCEWYSVSGG